MRGSTSGHRRPAWLAATVGFAIVGCTWAFAIARYGGPDEPAHIIRAAAVADGDLRGKPVPTLEEGYRQVLVPRALSTGDPGCFRHDASVSAACAVTVAGPGKVAVATSAGTAPPWYYLAVGAVTRLLSDGADTLAYRMAAVVLWALALGRALARSRTFGAGAWMLAAITPSAWFLGGVVGTSGVEIALITLALVEAIARFHDASPSSSLLRVTVPLSICLVLRPAALIDVAVVALALAPTVPRPVTRRTVATAVGPLISAGVAIGAWNRWTGLVVADRRTRDSTSLGSAIGRSLRGIPTTVHQAVGAMGWNEFFAPLVAQLLWIAALVLGVVWTARGSPRRWWHAVWLAAGLLLPTVVEVALHRRIGEIWQGRYSIPFAMAGVLFAASSAQRSRRVGHLLVCTAAFAEVLTLHHTLRRYMVGVDGSILLRGAAWQPALNAWLLLVLNAVAMTGLAVLAMSGHDVAEDVDDEVGEPGVVVHVELATRPELEVGEVRDR